MLYSTDLQQSNLYLTMSFFHMDRDLMLAMFVFQSPNNQVRYSLGFVRPVNQNTVPTPDIFSVRENDGELIVRTSLKADRTYSAYSVSMILTIV